MKKKQKNVGYLSMAYVVRCSIFL